MPLLSGHKNQRCKATDEPVKLTSVQKAIKLPLLVKSTSRARHPLLSPSFNSKIYGVRLGNQISPFLSRWQLCGYAKLCRSAGGDTVTYPPPHPDPGK